MSDQHPAPLHRALDEYVAHNYPHPISEVQDKEVRQAFWAGARVGIDAMLIASSHENPKEAERLLRVVEDEIDAAIKARNFELKLSKQNPANQ